MVWNGKEWCGMVRNGGKWFGMVRNGGMVWNGKEWWNDMEWCGMLRHWPLSSRDVIEIGLLKYFHDSELFHNERRK